MPDGYKVRIADGSEIGPLDLNAVKSWYAQGLINKDSAVLRPGSNRWTTLGQVLDLKASAPSARASGNGGSAGATPVAARRGGSGDYTIDVPDPSRWRTQAAGALLVVLAAVLGYFAWKPQDTRIELQDAPWAQIALGVLVLGLGLVAGWEAGRKLVRIALFVLAVLLFPIAGILLAQGVRGPALYAVLGALLCLFGFFAFLAGEYISWGRLLLALLPILGGGYLFARFTHSPETEARRQMREWTSPDRRLAEETLGMTVAVPHGWVLLKSGNPLVTASSDARASFGYPRGPGFGYLVAESSPVGIASLDQYLDRVWAIRQRAQPGIKQVGRSDLHVGRQPAKRLAGSWDGEDGRYQEWVTAWRDGWVYFALVAWVAEAPRAEQRVDELLQGISTQGEFAVRLQTAVVNATSDLPQLSPESVETLMSVSEAKVLEPDQVFRRSIDALSKALPSFSKQDTQDLSQITSAIFASLAPKDRARLAAYFTKARERQALSTAEDKDAIKLMKAAVIRLPAARRDRLQALYAQAIKASLASK
jgi:hypothetical protein